MIIMRTELNFPEINRHKVIVLVARMDILRTKRTNDKDVDICYSVKHSSC